ncbi:hypothetical protein [Streptomyces sp. NPDC002580]|uniref:hypothetical protein n=1 Tax=Streptomyces sp. NPDC002580 TaxID=3364653 RepID=UPI00367AB622
MVPYLGESLALVDCDDRQERRSRWNADQPFRQMAECGLAVVGAFLVAERTLAGMR